MINVAVAVLVAVGGRHRGPRIRASISYIRSDDGDTPSILVGWLGICDLDSLSVEGTGNLPKCQAKPESLER